MNQMALVDTLSKIEVMVKKAQAQVQKMDAESQLTEPATCLAAIRELLSSLFIAIGDEGDPRHLARSAVILAKAYLDVCENEHRED